MPPSHRSFLATWNRSLTRTHLVALIAFVLLNQGLAHLVQQRIDQQLARPVAQPVLGPGTSLHQRLQDQARRAGIPLFWITRTLLAERPALAESRALNGPLIHTVRQTIAAERLAADARHQPLPEIEACLEQGVLVVRDLNLSVACAPATVAP